MKTNYYKKDKSNYAFYIQSGEMKQVVENITDPTPTIFEDTSSVEVRFNVLIEDNESFMKYHALDKFIGKSITVGVMYGNGIELKSSFTVDAYERRFGSGKGPIITHVFQGTKGF
tara:strand:- start:1920 stop:2264 length:345 start_codon:yes stop_codon:yes gene_type:complete